MALERKELLLPITDAPLTPVSRPASAIMLMIFALCLASVSGAMMKILSETMEPPLVSFLRFAGYFILLLPLAVFQYGRRVFVTARPMVQVLRGLALVLGNTAFMYGVRQVDYANAIAILYIYPFLMIALSAWFLSERVTLISWMGVSGGFLGVVLVMRPNVSGIDFYGLFIVFTGFMVAVQMLLNRKLGVLSPPIVVAVWGAFTATLISGLSLPLYWRMPTQDEFFLIFLLAALTALSQTLMIVSMSWATADKIAPYTYSEIPFAVLVGYIFFQTTPDALSWTGICLIILSGIAVVVLPRLFKPHNTEMSR